MALYRDIKFNTGTALDSMGALPTITGATFSQKEKGYAIETGANKYITYDRQLLPNGAFSVVVWAKNHSNMNLLNFRGVISNLGDINGVSIGLGDTGIFFGGNNPAINLGNNYYRIFNYNNIDSIWHCFVFTYADLATSSFFVDGVQKSTLSTVSSGTPVSRANFNKACASNTSSKTGNSISRIKVYDTVLTQSQIDIEQAEFERAKIISRPNSGFVLSKPNDLSRYKGTGAGQGLIFASNMIPRGTTLTDISGNGNNGVVSNCVQNRGGVMFNGVNSYVSVANSPSLTLLSALSVCFRIKTSDTNAALVDKGDSATDRLGVFIVNTKMHLRINAFIRTSVGSIISNNKWQSICVVYDGIYCYFYVNGFLDEPRTALTTEAVNTTGSLIIGRLYDLSDSIYNFNGELQDLRIYNRAISLQEAKNYSNQFILPTFNEDFSTYSIGTL